MPNEFLTKTLWVLSSFSITVTMLNMLIAIMGDTFARVYSLKDIKSNQAKLRFVSEMENF